MALSSSSTPGAMGRTRAKAAGAAAGTAGLWLHITLTEPAAMLPVGHGAGPDGPRVPEHRRGAAGRCSRRARRRGKLDGRSADMREGGPRQGTALVGDLEGKLQHGRLPRESDGEVSRGTRRRGPVGRGRRGAEEVELCVASAELEARMEARALAERCRGEAQRQRVGRQQRLAAGSAASMLLGAGSGDQSVAAAAGRRPVLAGKVCGPLLGP